VEIWDILDENGNKTNRTIIRGQELQPGDYHLVVHIWIVNDKNEFLIQKRAEHLKLMPGIWAVTGGSAVQGEDSLTAAVREAKEEMGIDVDLANFTKIATVKRKDNIADVWLARQNVALEDIKLQTEEVSDARWASKEAIEAMLQEGSFHNYGEAYFKRVFRTAKKCLSCEIVKGVTDTIGGTILDTKHFHAHQDFAYPIPGLVILASKRHIYSIDEMTEEEAFEYIEVMRAIRTAQRKVIGIEHVYYFYNEDTSHHFHTWMVPRYEWMSSFGKSVESVRPVLLNARDNMNNEENIENVKLAAQGLYEELKKLQLNCYKIGDK
jgi:8-oxo-dGTP pyrophosphatase MutT (NUDIX family)/diadenosine tetraphosphate (Ap4A) HIT family hydrolase